MKPYKNIFLNSFMAFVSAFILTTIIHESGHFISYLLAGAQPELFHNYVQTSDNTLSLQIKIIAAMAGPVISLLQGIIFTMLVVKNQKNNARYLLFLWLSLLGFINFFGYLMLTPLSTKGDTGKVAELLHISYVARIIIAVIGLATLIFIVVKIGRYFANFIPTRTELPIRGKYVNFLVMFPIIAGSMVNVILAFPIPVILSVIYPATSAYVILSSYGVILKTERQQMPDSDLDKKISLFLVIIVMTCIILNRILTTGIG